MASINIPPPPPPPIDADLFDPDFYRALNPDLAGFSDERAKTHFEEFGLNEGRKFSPFFDLDFYRNNNSDLTDFTNEELYEHFLIAGAKEGRKFSNFFDVTYYLDNNPDLGEAGLDTSQEAIEHFFNSGLEEGRNFSRFFDPEYYQLNNPDLRAAGLTTTEQLFVHYEFFGLNEGRRASLLFDPSYYLDTNRDLATQGFNNQQGFEHYLNFGEAEGRRPSLFYDPEAIDALILREASPQTDPANPQTTPTANRAIIKWDVPKGGALTYSFVTTASAFSYPGSESGVGEVGDTIKNSVRQVMQKYSEVLPFRLVEVPDRPPSEGQIRIMFSDGPEYAYTYEPGDEIGGDVHLSRDFETDQTGLAFSGIPGSFGYETLVHEIGHALGLKHPNNYQSFALNNDGVQVAADEAPFLSFPKDNNTNTAMSYNSTGIGGITPMAYDVRSLQSIYGIGDFNQTDTTYTFDSSKFLQIKQTIWDGGGNDTLDFSALLANNTYFFDMNEGGRNTTTSALNGATYIALGDTSGRTYAADLYATTIAYGVIIENLIGTQGNDAILGNNRGNIIVGGEGADAITGARGADALTGGQSSDKFSYALGDGGSAPSQADTITDFKDGEDIIALGSGLRFEDLLITAFGNDTLLGVPSSGEILTRLVGIQPQVLTSADFTIF